MVLKRLIPLIGIMLMLAGCFRQADEPFDTVNSQNAPQSIAPTQDITIIDPNATNVPLPTTESQQVEPTETLIVINPGAGEATATTETILVPPTSTLLTIPTATEATFVTPEPNVEVELPTATPPEESVEATLEPTPTVEGGEVVTTSNSECDYVVESGDNLFRIAINHGVSLHALLQENDLSEASIIQPGQVIKIPDCNANGTSSQPLASEEAPTEAAPSACQYTVTSGDTLYDIAIALDVALDDLLNENDLTGSSIIIPGEVLTIPGCIDNSVSSGSSVSVSPGAEVTQTISNVTIHTVTADDTLLSIAQLYGVTVNDIIQNNSIPDPNHLTVGQQLLIPGLQN